MLKHAIVAALLLVTNAFSLSAQSVDLEIKSVSGADQIHTAKGVIISPKGLLATVAVAGTDPSKISLEGQKQPLKLLAYDGVSRMALLALPKGYEVDAWLSPKGDSSYLQPAEALVCGTGKTASTSRFICREKRFNGKVLPLSLLRVNHANKGVVPGTPLHGEDGMMVAMAHQPIVDSETSTYALPVEVLKHLLKLSELKPDGEVQQLKRCWVGIAMDALNDAPVVTGVRPESPARKGGIVKGDILLSVAGKPVREYADVVNAFYYLLPNEAVTFKVLRGTELKELRVVPEVNPLLK